MGINSGAKSKKNIFKNSQILVAVIGFSGGIIVAILTAFLTPLATYFFENNKAKQANDECSELKKRYADLQNKDADYRRRLAYQLDEINDKSNNDFKERKVPVIEILGINATGPIHQGRELLQKLLNKGAKIRILLLDPCSSACVKRRKYENDSVGRIPAELQASLYILADIQQQVKKTKSSNLELRFHDSDPDRSLIMIDADSDHGVIMDNAYIQPKGARGVEGDMHRLLPERDSRYYQDDLAYFRHLWKQAKKVKLTCSPFNPQNWPYEVLSAPASVESAKRQ